MTFEKIAKYLKAKEDKSLDYEDLIHKYPNSISFGTNITYIVDKHIPQQMKYGELHNLPKGFYKFNHHVPADKQKNFINKVEKLSQYGIKVNINTDDSSVFGYIEKI